MVLKTALGIHKQTHLASVVACQKMSTPSENNIGESDCCGNGCANCILYSKPLSTRTTRTELLSKSNVLHAYRKYELIQRVQLGHRLLQLRFTIADDKKQLTDFILDCPPGHHVMMRAPLPQTAENLNNKYLLRPYSPFWTDVTQFEFEILVNLKPNGKMTRYIENLKLGDVVEFRGPIGTFAHEPSANSARVLILFSHGVAIAPTIPIVESILDDEEDMTRIFHYSCFESLESVIFRDKLMEFKKFWNFSSRIYLSRQRCTDGCDQADCEHFSKLLKYKEEVHPCRLGKDQICTDLGKFESFPKEIVICGSKCFQDFVVESLNGCKVNKENVHIL